MYIHRLKVYICFIHVIYIFINRNYLSNLSNELKPKWMTPAMEEVARLKKKSVELPDAVVNPQSPRMTRSRLAKTKRKIINV